MIGEKMQITPDNGIAQSSLDRSSEAKNIQQNEKLEQKVEKKDDIRGGLAEEMKSLDPNKGNHVDVLT